MPAKWIVAAGTMALCFILLPPLQSSQSQPDI